MIYRFHAREAGSQRMMEVQLQAPAGEPLDYLNAGLRATFSKQGIEFDSLEYIGSIDTDFQGLVVPAEEPHLPSTLSEERRTAKIYGWDNPIGNAQADNKCVVPGCGRESRFHLCKTHWIPGNVVEIEGRRFVISLWLVERAGQMLLIPLNDYTLGVNFGGQQEFERQLSAKGYKVHGLISSEEEVEAAKQRYSGLRLTFWSPDLPDGEDGPR